jgi:hypothetical protein
MKKSITMLSVVTAVIAIISASLGVFYSFGGEQRTVTNIYGQTVTLFGDGIYLNDSFMKVGTTKGTDIAIIIVSILLLSILSIFKSRKFSPFLQTGFLSIILYDSTCLLMGVNFNRLFLLYIIQFGCSFFATILSLSNLIKSENINNSIYKKKLKGTAIFMIVGGCSTLVWMTFIIPVIISGQPMNNIEVYTTEPTFAIDLAIILPSAVFCGVMLLKQNAIGYKIAPVLLTFLSGVGLCVIMQTIIQKAFGIELPIDQLFGMVITFVILGTIATVLNVKLLKYAQ